jgi:hypothetical protein
MRKSLQPACNQQHSLNQKISFQHNPLVVVVYRRFSATTTKEKAISDRNLPCRTYMLPTKSYMHSKPQATNNSQRGVSYHSTTLPFRNLPNVS